jgi:hypothetical protein
MDVSRLGGNVTGNRHYRNLRPASLSAALPATKVELELGTGDGYKPRDLWLAQAAVSGVINYLTNQNLSGILHL